MDYLLDTHTFLWFVNDNDQLSATAREVIEHPDHTIYISIASLWEIAIKVSLGKLKAPLPLSDFISQQLHENDITLLGITVMHLNTVANLPFHHRDPFDRLIVAQAKTEGLSILGVDAIFDAYAVKRLW
ncbi:MAG: type II toxin-antitoxin system VapC family toxin [Phototrophicaceae bacterium]